MRPDRVVAAFRRRLPVPSRGRRRGAPVSAAVIALAAAAIASLLLQPAAVTAKTAPTLRLEPSAVEVGGGQAFMLYVVLNADDPTSGVRTDVVFDPTLIQVLDVAPGQAYSGGLFQYGTTDDCSHRSVEAAVVSANETGTLRNVTTLIPPGGAMVPPGEVIVARLIMQARDGPGGTTSVELQKSTVRDDHRRSLEVSGQPVAVTIAASAAPSGSVEPSPAIPDATPVPSLDGGLISPPPSASAGPADVIVTPESLTVEYCAAATVDLTVRTNVAISSVVTDLSFDENLIRITKLELGPDWGLGTIVAGVSGQTMEEAIAQANATGVLQQVGAFLMPGGPNLPTGESVVLRVTVAGRVARPSSLTVTSAAILDSNMAPIEVNQASAQPSSGDGGVASVDSPALAGLVAVVAVIALVGVILLIRLRVLPRPTLRRWPFAVALLLGLIPVAMFAAMVAMLVVNSLPVLTRPGLGAILSDHFTSNFSLGGATGEYGLIPAAWGTVEITVIAIGIALPVSLAMAIVATEFPLGPLGRLLRPLLGILSGIPPIVYAVAGAVFVTIFIAPKFAGSADVNAFNAFVSDNSAALGITLDKWPPPGVPWSPTSFPWPPNSGGLPSSTLLGGLLIALLVIPFMTPLIFDAMRNIPSAAREASFALGANRGYTLRRVVLPLAMPGIVAALGLATLKALGDVLIIALVVGWQAETLPNPIVDVLERTSSLAAEGANLLGNLQAGAGQYCDPKTAACAVGYTSALVLLVVAAAVVVVASVVEGRLRRRLRA